MVWQDRYPQNTQKCLHSKVQAIQKFSVNTNDDCIYQENFLTKHVNCWTLKSNKGRNSTGNSTVYLKYFILIQAICLPESVDQFCFILRKCGYIACPM